MFPENICSETLSSPSTPIELHNPQGGELDESELDNTMGNDLARKRPTTPERNNDNEDLSRIFTPLYRPCVEYFGNTQMLPCITSEAEKFQRAVPDGCNFKEYALSMGLKYPEVWYTHLRDCPPDTQERMMSMLGDNVNQSPELIRMTDKNKEIAQDGKIAPPETLEDNREEAIDDTSQLKIGQVTPEEESTIDGILARIGKGPL